MFSLVLRQLFNCLQTLTCQKEMPKIKIRNRKSTDSVTEKSTETTEKTSLF